MATIQANTSESIFKIQNWLGVNEAPEGEARLKQGEAAAMRNFKITAGGALKKRGGSVNVAGLMQSYNLEEGERTELYRETGITQKILTLYPRATTDSVGTAMPDGDGVAADYYGANTYTGYYIQDGGLYKFEQVTYTEPEQISGSLQAGFTGDASGLYIGAYALAFDEPPIFHDGAWDTSKGAVTAIFSGDGWAGSHDIPIWGYQKTKYLIPSEGGGIISVFRKNGAPTAEELLEGINTTGRYIKATEISAWADVNAGFRVDLSTEHYRSAYYSWYFHAMHSVGNGADSVVRGIWSGFVDGREVLCAACNGYLWELEYQDGVWSKVSCGALGTDKDVSMFGFDEKLYILNGTQYKVWDGTILEDVEGYVPLIATAAPPEGGGTLLEPVNKLTGRRRMRFSPDGEATTFHLLNDSRIFQIESAKIVGGAAITDFTADAVDGTITFTSPPAKGVSSLEVTYSVVAVDAVTVRSMRYMELYNGAQDSRVFLYGDGTNRCIYSGIDENGLGRADYFPDLNVAHIGDANTPITGMIRHYNKLLAFKLDSAWVLSYDSISLADGSVTAGFYVAPVNRSVGNCAPGQALLVENQPRTLDGRSVVEWKTSSSGSITGDQRNAKRVSQRVDTSIRKFNLETAKTFYDKYAHEYYVIGADGTALVNGVDADAWYIYTDFDAVCLINYKDELYFGTADGYLRHFTEAAFSDNGRAIDCYWESGSMPFQRDFMRKYSAMIWIGIRPEEKGYLKVTAETDRKSDFAEYSFTTDDAGAVPTMHRLKLKAKKFTYYKLILENNTADTTATVVSADIRVRNTGYVR